MYKFKVAVTRVSALLGAVGLLVGVGASTIPAFTAVASADSLNPLTHRSLELSSSSPGWSYKDGSGNVTYAEPNSGANGKQTGNTFSFDVSSTQAINGMSFQYCTTAAGNCFSPGNDGYTGTSPTATRNGDSTSTSDLYINTSTPAEISSGTYTAITTSPRNTTCYKANGSTVVPDCSFTGTPATSGTDEFPGMPKMDDTEGNFVVLTCTSACSTPSNFAYSSGWTMQAINLEAANPDLATGATGKPNMFQLLRSSGASLTSGEAVQVIFYGTDGNNITNPGAGAFFVKINDYYDTNATPALGDMVPTDHEFGTSACLSPHDACIVDGGVTVANVMNQSIEIQTKVLETMDFSVGTVDPDTLSNAQLTAATGGALTTPGQCDPILTAFLPAHSQNTLILGNENAEDSLMTSEAFGTHSYFRLSSNSSGGATVYYTGTTLSNTENNQIDPAGITNASSIVGTEQFGLGLDTTGGGPTYAPDYSVANSDGATSVKYENGEDTDNGVNTPGHGAPGATGGIFGVSSDWTTYESGSGGAAHNPQLGPLVPTTNYGGSSGGINSPAAGDGNTTATFSFSPTATTIPVPMATESTAVVNCITGKVRYMANIAATTPAGIYTTKVNYVASPQY